MWRTTSLRTSVTTFPTCSSKPLVIGKGAGKAACTHGVAVRCRRICPQTGADYIVTAALLLPENDKPRCRDAPWCVRRYGICSPVGIMNRRNFPHLQWCLKEAANPERVTEYSPGCKPWERVCCIQKTVLAPHSRQARCPQGSEGCK